MTIMGIRYALNTFNFYLQIITLTNGILALSPQRTLIPYEQNKWSITPYVSS